MENLIKTKSTFGIFMHYTLPAVASMVVSSLYTVVDGIFVGRGVGDTALAAVNIVFPFIMFQIAFSMLFAIGGANLFSIRLGRGDKAGANNMFNQAMTLLLIGSVVINLLAALFPAAFCTLLGADELLLPQAVAYMRWVAIFGIAFMPGVGLSVFVRNDGSPRLAMAGTLAGAVFNIGLDWLFIMVFGWGIEGAAIATGIGQVASLLVYCTHLLRKKGILRIRRPRFEKGQVGRLIFNGIPSFLMEFCQSTITLSFNVALMAYMGPGGVSAYSVVMYVCSLFTMVLVGITQGAQPIISFCHGLREPKRANSVYRMGIITSLVMTALCYLLVTLFSRPLTGLFLPGDGELTQIANEMMALYFLGFFPVGITLMNILFLQATEREIPSIVVSVLRCVGFVQLFLLVLPGPLGAVGLYLAFLCGESCNCLISVVLRGLALRRTARLEAKAATAQADDAPLPPGRLCPEWEDA